jgi:CRP-like cAMP-binding protein
MRILLLRPAAHLHLSLGSTAAENLLAVERLEGWFFERVGVRWLRVFDDESPPVSAFGGTGNRLLATLPATDLELLRPELETIALDQDVVLARAGDEIDYVYFPHSGAILLMIDMADGHTVATGVVGREGAFGGLAVLGSSPLGVTAVVRAAGTASRISAARFQAAFDRSPTIRQAVLKYIRMLLIQLEHGSACNALHPVETRMARWLLQLRDRVDSDVLPLTQHALSQILGVRRTTVTLLMRNLRTRGAIRSEQRGRIEIDRARLSAAACECHRVMRFEAEEVLASHKTRIRPAPIAKHTCRA